MESSLCTKQSLESDDFQNWAKFLGEAPGQMHRKVWEWCFISQALSEHGALVPEKSGLGFAVGEEPLAACLASFGTDIVATDLETEAAVAMGWVESGQHANGMEKLNGRGLCPALEFQDRVTFEFCDMNAIPAKYHEKFDFLWSSCALEHLGSIDLGIRFILESIKCLKRGGIAVHTTEFNVSSNDKTITSGDTVLFRRTDIDCIIQQVRAAGCHIKMNWDFGGQPEDYHVDVPPYSHDPHLKLRLGEYTTTSIGLAITKI